MLLALAEARKLAPGTPLLALTEAMVYSRLDKTDERIASLQQALASSNQDELSKRDRAMVLDNLAFTMMSKGNLDEALKLFDQENAENPGSAWGWHNASIAYDRAGKCTEALERSDRALSVFEFGVARNVNNLLRLKLGLPTPRLDHPQDAEDRDNAALTLVSYANWLKSQGSDRYDAAESSFQRAIATDPNRAESYAQLGIFYRTDLHRYDQAAATYAAALQRDPQKVNYRYRYAQSLAQLPGRAAEAEQVYLALLQDKPRLVDVRSDYARLLATQGRFADAEREIQVALKYDAKDAYTNQAYAELRAARQQAGMKDLN
jgi:tetratricopeptide (TPR) repeat protein